MYEPKLNVDALLQGYVGTDPKQVGALRGYLVGSGNQTQDTQNSTNGPGK